MQSTEREHTIFSCLQVSARNASCIRAMGDALGLPRPKHSTSGFRAENSFHEVCIISTSIQREKDTLGNRAVERRRELESNDGREASANHSSCRSWSLKVARTAERGGDVLFLCLLIFRALTGVNSEYESDIGFWQQALVSSGQNLTCIIEPPIPSPSNKHK
jgi:hypothetical protein